MNRILAVLSTAFLFLAGSPVTAQESPPANPPSPCSDPAHRAFDFWIGEWDVTQNDQPAGFNRIEAIDGGCALSENWTSAQGNFTGHSLNAFDRSSGRWHQTWVDSGGTILKLDGGPQANPDPEHDQEMMVLEGEAPGPDGALRLNRISWTPNADGSVRQHWEVKGDAGWTTAFDGLYVRRSTAQ